MQPQYEPADAQSIDYLDKQIDSLFDELKKRIYDLTAPRSTWFDKMKGWTGKQMRTFADRLQQPKQNPLFAKGPTQENNLSLNLEQYAQIKVLVEELEIKINENNGFIDNILDQYKTRLKNLIKSYVARPKVVPRVIKSEPNVEKSFTGSEFDERIPGGYVQHDPWTLEPHKEEPEAEEPPSKIEPKAEPTPIPKIEPEKTTQAPTEPRRRKRRERILPQTQEEAPKVRQVSPEDVENIKLGYALDLAKHLFGTPSESDLKMAIEQTKDHDIGQIDASRYNDFIKIAKEFKNKNSAQPMAASESPTQQPQIGPMDVPPAPASNEKTKDQLLAMTGKELKDFLKDHDPELVDAYNDREWHSKHLRKEIVLSYLASKNHKRQSESFEGRIQLYKTLLREDVRPKLIHYQLQNIPFNEKLSMILKRIKD
jgi:hypothetical protein